MKYKQDIIDNSVFLKMNDLEVTNMLKQVTVSDFCIMSNILIHRLKKLIVFKQ